MDPKIVMSTTETPVARTSPQYTPRAPPKGPGNHFSFPSKFAARYRGTSRRRSQENNRAADAKPSTQCLPVRVWDGPQQQNISALVQEGVEGDYIVMAAGRAATCWLLRRPCSI